MKKSLTKGITLENKQKRGMKRNNRTNRTNRTKGKKKKNMDYPQWMVNVVRNDLEVSVREAVDAIEMYMLTEAGQMELSAVLKKFGIDNKKALTVALSRPLERLIF